MIGDGQVPQTVQFPSNLYAQSDLIIRPKTDINKIEMLNRRS